MALDQLSGRHRLGRYGHADLAADIADKSIANAIKNGISEHYDLLSGKPLGIRDYFNSKKYAASSLRPNRPTLQTRW